MTRPMTEDSPGKQAANYGYRIRQLERRPAPLSASISMFRAAYYSSPIDNISGTLQNVTWENWVNCDPDVFGPRKASDGTADPVVGVDDVLIIRLLAAGTYTFIMGHHFTTSGTHVLPSGVQIGYSDESGAPAVAGYPDFSHAGPVTSYNSQGYVTGVLIRTYPYWDHAYGGVSGGDWPDFSAAGFVAWYANIATNQASGTGRADEGYLEIQYQPSIAWCTE